MATLKQIQEAIKEKQKGLNADVKNLLLISKENYNKTINEEAEKVLKEKQYKNILNQFGVKQI